MLRRMPGIAFGGPITDGDPSSSLFGCDLSGRMISCEVSTAIAPLSLRAGRWHPVRARSCFVAVLSKTAMLDKSKPVVASLASRMPAGNLGNKLM
jgi:hypothetical protein